MDLLCIMQNSPKPGYLFSNSSPISDQNLAKICTISLQKLIKIKQELIENGVASSDENGLFSRRIVRDYERSLTNKINGKNGGNPALKAKSRLTEPDNQNYKNGLTEHSENSPTEPDKPPLTGAIVTTSTSITRKQEGEKKAASANPVPLIPVPIDPLPGWLEEFMEIKGWNEQSARANYEKFVEKNLGKTKTLTGWKLDWCRWWAKDEEIKKPVKSNRIVL